MTKIFAFATVSAIALTGAMSAQADEWRGWAIHPDDYPNTVAMQAFAEKVAEVTEGSITPTVYANGILGSQPDAIAQVRAGDLGHELAA